MPSRTQVMHARVFGTSSTTTRQSKQTPIPQKTPRGDPRHGRAGRPRALREQHGGDRLAEVRLHRLSVDGHRHGRAAFDGVAERQAAVPLTHEANPKSGSPSRSRSTSIPRPGPARREPGGSVGARLVAGDVLVHEVVDERHAEQCLGAGAGSKVAHRRGREIAAPRVLDRERDPQRLAQLAQLTGARQAPDLRDLQIDRVHSACVKRAEESRRVADRLVEDHRQRRQPPHVEALLQRRARLLEVDAVTRLEQARRDDRVLRAPAAVRVRDHDAVVAQCLEHHVHTGSVVTGRCPELQLKLVDAEPLQPLDLSRHLLRRPERDRGVQGVGLETAAAEERCQR